MFAHKGYRLWFWAGRDHSVSPELGIVELNSEIDAPVICHVAIALFHFSRSDMLSRLTSIMQTWVAGVTATSIFAIRGQANVSNNTGRPLGWVRKQNFVGAIPWISIGYSTLGSRTSST